MKEIIKKAAEAFFSDKQHSDKSLVNITADGQCFHEWHDANEHSKSIGSTEDERKIEEIKRSDIAPGENKKSIPEQIEECVTVEEVEALVKQNWSKANKELAAAKIESLKA